MRRFLVVAGLVVLVGLAGCDIAAGPSPGPGGPVIVDGWVYPTAAPLPIGATVVPLEVEALQRIPLGAGVGCMEALGTATIEYRAGDPSPIRYHQPGQPGREVRWVWQFGFSARDVDGRLEIVAPDGKVVGRDGDTLALGGGSVGPEPDAPFHVCMGEYLPRPLGSG